MSGARQQIDSGYLAPDAKSRRAGLLRTAANSATYRHLSQNSDILSSDSHRRCSVRATNIGKSEWEDVDAAIKRQNRQKADFEFAETVEPIVGPGIQPLRDGLQFGI